MTSFGSVSSNSLPKKREPFSNFWNRFSQFVIRGEGDRIFVFVLILLNAVFLLPGIGDEALLPQGDETMHIATIRESLASSSYLFPKFEGVLNLYKPPALFWLGMLSDSIFGIGFFGERFPSFLLFLGVSLLIYLGLRRAKTPPIYAFGLALAYTLTLGVFKFARLAMMESLLAFFITAISVLILEFRLSGKKVWLGFGGLLSGIAILIKGPLFQIYSGALLVSFSCFSIFLISKSGIWTGRRRIWKELQHHLLFHISSLIIPGIWILVLLSFSNLGKEFLRIFFFTENLGKFSSATANQAEWIIPAGFLLYSFPFSLALAFAFLSGLFRKSRNFRSTMGSSFLWAIVSIAIVHISPNRKDFYYLLPLIPVSFLAIGLSFSDKKNTSDGIRIRNWLSWNFIFSFTIALILCIGMFAFGLFLDRLSWMEPVFLLLLVILVFFVRSRMRKEDGVPTIIYSGNLWIAAFLLVYLQFSVLPRLSLSEVPDHGPILSAKQICVVSENPWTAWTFRNALPGIDIAHSIPGAERNCIDGRRHLIVFDPNFTRKEEYRLIQTQFVWKRNLNGKELLSPSKGKDQIYFYEPIRNFDSGAPEQP